MTVAYDIVDNHRRHTPNSMNIDAMIDEEEAPEKNSLRCYKISEIFLNIAHTMKNKTSNPLLANIK
jgi:hypothetical protein